MRVTRKRFDQIYDLTSSAVCHGDAQMFMPCWDIHGSGAPCLVAAKDYMPKLISQSSSTTVYKDIEIKLLKVLQPTSLQERDQGQAVDSERVRFRTD